MTTYGKRTRPANDAATEFERSWTWVKVSRTFRNLNPVCQCIEDGRRCLSKAELVHHLISPAVSWDLRMEYRNLVSLCQRHHTPHAGDAGLWDYAPTKLLVENEWFVHPPRARGQKPAPTNEPSTPKVEELLADVRNVDLDELLATFGK